MTFRAKPVVKRDHKPAWETQDRRNFYLNLGFGLIVFLAVLILAIAAGLSWYNSHLAPVGSVDGESISKDEFADRYKIETWRLDEAEARTRTAVTAGHLTEAQGTSLQSTIAQQRQSLPATTLERLIDTKYQAKLAAQEGVTVAPEEIDARLATEATTPESRHSWVIEVAPQTDLGAIGPSAAQKSRREGQGRGRAEGHHRRQELGGRRADRLDRCVDRAAGRRPRLAPGQRHASRRGMAEGRLRRPGQHADRGHRGDRRGLSDRPRHRDRPVVGRSGLPDQVREQGHRPRQVPRRPPGRRHPRQAPGQDRRRRHGERPAAQGRRDLHPRSRRRPPGRLHQGPPHPVRAEGRSGERLDGPGQRSLVGSRPVAGDRDVRPAQGRPEPVRRHRPQGEPGDAGAGPERQRRQAALLRQRQLRSTRSS